MIFYQILSTYSLWKCIETSLKNLKVDSGTVRVNVSLRLQLLKVKTLASHSPHTNMARFESCCTVHAISGLSFLLVLSLPPKGFSSGTPVLPLSLKKPNNSRFQFDLERTDTFHRVPIHKNS